MIEYIKIARPDHWFKNIFMLPGTALALIIVPIRYSYLYFTLMLGLLSTCLIASANYVVMEISPLHRLGRHPDLCPFFPRHSHAEFSHGKAYRKRYGNIESAIKKRD